MSQIKAELRNMIDLFESLSDFIYDTETPWQGQIFKLKADLMSWDDCIEFLSSYIT